LSKSRRKLPKWPDEVIEEWLLYFANDIGWPPAEPFGTDRWRGILGNRPLSWWTEVGWKQEKVDCSRPKLSSTTQRRIDAVSGPIYAGTASETEKGQYRRPFQYLLENGVFANPALAMRDTGRLHFIDGHHRNACKRQTPIVKLNLRCRPSSARRAIAPAAPDRKTSRGRKW
jgi:hypothetical protein